MLVKNTESDTIPDVLLLQNKEMQEVGNIELQNILKDTFESFTVSLNSEDITIQQQNLDCIKSIVDGSSFTKTKFTEVQVNMPDEFEIADKLKNYATVCIAEPIPTQVSYNIGTENIENGKEGETLENTEMGLEESSIITEIENAAISLYNIDGNDSDVKNLFGATTGFDSALGYDTMQNKPVDNLSNVNIINVKSILPPLQSITNSTNSLKLPEVDVINLNKRNSTMEALEMSLACEEEIPSTWMDVISLMNSSDQLNVFEHENISQTHALPTGLQSYTDVSTYPSTVGLVDINNDTVSPLYMHEQGSLSLNESGNTALSNVAVQTENTSPRVTTLQDVTTDAGICKCGPCYSEDSCANDANSTCIPKNEKSQATKETTNSPCLAQQKQCCAEPKRSKNKVPRGTMCSEKRDECCVVVCLKSLDQLRQILSLANGCNNFQSLTLACVSGDLCAIDK